MGTGCAPRAKAAIVALLAAGTVLALLPLFGNDFISCERIRETNHAFPFGRRGEYGSSVRDWAL